MRQREQTRARPSGVLHRSPSETTAGVVTPRYRKQRCSRPVQNRPFERDCCSRDRKSPSSMATRYCSSSESRAHRAMHDGGFPALAMLGRTSRNYSPLPFPGCKAQVHHESLGNILRDADLHNLPKLRYFRGRGLRLVPGGAPASNQPSRRGDYGDCRAQPVNSAQMDASLGVDFVYSLQWIAEKGDTTDRRNAV